MPEAEEPDPALEPDGVLPGADEGEEGDLPPGIVPQPEPAPDDPGNQDYSTEVVVNRPADEGDVNTDDGEQLPVTDAIVDNRDNAAGKRFKVIYGAWSLSTVEDGCYGADFAAVAARSGDETARARFTCTILPAGWYSVYAWWPASSNHATSVAYEIRHANGTSVVRVDQTKGGKQWFLLGRFNFDTGLHAVDVHNGQAGISGTVCADAVRFSAAGP
jgi:hypothetical protein